MTEETKAAVCSHTNIFGGFTSLDCSVFSTGLKGGDGDHGGRVDVRIKVADGDVYFSIDGEELTITARGDNEMTTIADAFRFIAGKLSPLCREGRGVRTRDSISPKALRAFLAKQCAGMNDRGEKISSIRVNAADFGFKSVDALAKAVNKTNTTNIVRGVTEGIERFYFSTARANATGVVVVIEAKEVNE